MHENIYKPPAVDARPIAPVDAAVSENYYVVGIPKLVALHVLTLSFYHLVWFYRHWSSHKQRTGEDVWPLPRSIFSIFTAHRLFGALSRAAGSRASHFAHSGQATIYVVLSVASNVTGRIGEKISDDFVFLDVISFGCAVMSVVPLIAAQRAANAAAGDPGGTTNASFTVANYAWSALGFLFWLLVLIGIFMPDGEF